MGSFYMLSVLTRKAVFEDEEGEREVKTRLSKLYETIQTNQKLTQPIYTKPSGQRLRGDKLENDTNKSQPYKSQPILNKGTRNTRENKNERLNQSANMVEDLDLEVSEQDLFLDTYLYFFLSYSVF